MPLYAGVCETNITPPLGVWMCGYAYRSTGCTSVHDELFARALVLNDGRKAVAVVSTDLLSLKFESVRRIREEASARTGIAKEAILLNSSHTHGGPNVCQLLTMGEPDESYLDVLERKLIGIILQAAANLRPARLAFSSANGQIGINRRQSTEAGGMVLGHNPSGPVMDHVNVATVLDSLDEPFAVLFNHACHGTTMGGDNLAITGDWPGAACEYIKENSLYAITPLFVQGCCGNINPIRRGSFEAVRLNGETIGQSVVNALNDSASNILDDQTLDFEEATVELPLQPPPPLEICEANAREWEARAEKERGTVSAGALMHSEGLATYHRHEAAYAASGALPTKPFTIQRIKIGGATLLAMPGEVFVQYALDFERLCGGRALALSYSNGVHGYVPTAAAFPLGGYEVASAHRYYDSLMFTDQCEALVRETAYRLLGFKNADMTPYPD